VSTPRKPGGPLSGFAIPIETAREDIDAANRRMGGKGLWVLAFAARIIEPAEVPELIGDPMTKTHELGSSAWSASSTRSA
jgi:Ca2+-transporting ATPase